MTAKGFPYSTSFSLSAKLHIRTKQISLPDLPAPQNIEFLSSGGGCL